MPDNEAIDQGVVDAILTPKAPANPAAATPPRDTRNGQFIKENPPGVTLRDDDKFSLDNQIRETPEQARARIMKAAEEAANNPQPNVPVKDDIKPNVAADEDPNEEENPDDQGDEDENDENPDESGDDDIDNFLVDVKVDGKDEEVSLKDLKANWSGNKFVEKQLQQTVERRKAAETDAYQAHQVLGVQVQKLQQIDTLLGSVTGANIDWQKLQAEKPEEYQRKRLEFFEAEKAQRDVQKAISEAQAEQERLNTEAKARFIEAQSHQLAAKVPDMADPKKAPVLMGRIAETAELFGFSRQELANVVDHRVLVLLHNFTQLRENVESKKETLKPEKTQRLIKHLKRPSSSSSRSQVQNSQSRKLDQQAIDRARSTGHVDDVAATLIQRTARSNLNGAR